MTEIKMHITENARALLRQHCRGTKHGELVPELILGVDPNDLSEGKCIIGYHEKKVWDDAPPHWRFMIDGEEFLISNPAPVLLKLLQNATLDIDAAGVSFEFRLSQ